MYGAPASALLCDEERCRGYQVVTDGWSTSDQERESRDDSAPVVVVVVTHRCDTHHGDAWITVQLFKIIGLNALR